jgi:hypothetical protein
MYNSQREMIEALRATPETLKALLNSAAEAQIRHGRDGDENWSAVEVICHLRDTEEIILRRMRTMRDDEDPVISGFDQEGLARERDYAADDPHTALAAFAEFRRQHTVELEALTAGQWERTGQHTTLGTVTIFNHTLHMVWHDAIHMAQVARQLS